MKNFTKLSLHKQFIFVIPFFLLIITSGNLYAQCADTSPTGDCDGDLIINADDLDDDNDGILDADECYIDSRLQKNGFGIGTDLLQATFHGVIALTEEGYVVFGQKYGPDGTIQRSPLLLNETNYPNDFTGEVLRASAGGDLFGLSEQVILTTDGLFTYGNAGFVINSSSLNSNGSHPLPAGVGVSDIRSMHATYQNLAIITNTGELWMRSIQGVLNGDSTTTANVWSKPTFTSPVVSVRITKQRAFVYTEDQKIFTWGTLALKGDATNATTTTVPVEMTNPLPVGVDIAQIALIHAGDNLASYLLLGMNGLVYSLGENSFGQLGIGTTTDTLSWNTVLNEAGTVPMTNVVFISGQDQDGVTDVPNASLMTSAEELFSWGSNDAGAIGLDITGNFASLPVAPKKEDGNGNLISVNVSPGITYVENGGHITPIVLDDKYYNVGHNLKGAFGDGTTTNRPSYSESPLGVELIAGQNSYCDLDGDGIPNHLDLDSDGDGCSDAIEGDGAFTTVNLVLNSNMDGGNTGTGFTGITGVSPVQTNLGTNVDTTPGSSTYGVPIVNATVAVQGEGVSTDKTLESCTDTDGDGVGDLVDLDDDNDGVLDTDELSCTSTIISKTGVVISVPSTVSYVTNGGYQSMVDGIDNNNVAIRSPSGTLSNSTLLQISFPTAKRLSYLEIAHYQYQTLFAIGSTYKIQASNDSTNWTDVTSILTWDYFQQGLSPISTSHIVDVKAKHSYLYYRIFGISVTSADGWASELYFKEFNCVDIDTDNDGVDDRLDLDSDGDGCPDALEAGVTGTLTAAPADMGATTGLANALAQLPYGNNGLSNVLEINDSSYATTNYTSTYADFATDNTLSVCADTDGDGVGDLVDLDDDNDGILDSVEEKNETGCEGDACSWYPSSIGARDNMLALTSNNGGPNSTLTSKYAFNLGYPSGSTSIIASAGEVRIGDGLYGGLETISLISFSTVDDAHLDPINKNHYMELDFTTKNFTGTYALNSLIGTVTTPISIMISDNAFASSYSVLACNFTPTSSSSGQLFNVSAIPLLPNITYTMRIYFHGRRNQSQGSLGDDYFFSGTRNYSASSAYGCPSISLNNDIDLDNDGIPNRLDLDSDGDGCSDAIEGDGVFTTANLVTDTNFPGGNTGTGFIGITGASPVQTNLGTNVDTTSGSPTYGVPIVGPSTTAVTQGIGISANKNVEICTDTDGDGAVDYFDLDDDNDGILDADELCDEIYNCLDENNFVGGDRSSIVSNTSTDIPLQSGDISNLFDGLFTTPNTVLFVNNSDITNRVLYSFELSCDIILTRVRHDHAGGMPSPTFLNQNSQVVFQGWDSVASAWVDISNIHTATGTTINTFGGGNL